MLDLLTAWLLTYLVHGTLLLGGVWLLTRLWRRMPVTWSEALWRTAMLGGLATATLQLALDVEPAAGRMAVVTAAPVTPMAHAPSAPPLATPPAAPRTRPDVASAGTDPVPALEPVFAPAPVRAAPPTPALPPRTWLALLWGAGALLVWIRHGRAARALRRHLRRRTPIESGRLFTRLAALARTAGLRRAPRLSLVANLGSPLAIGIRQPEIVIPQRALDQLTAAQQDAMLAHELAHHIRRDALWQALTRVIGGVFFFQPLHALARRRLHESAELLSDAWAVEHTGCSRSLAECLTVVAGWVVSAPRSHPAPAMAAHGSMLTQRVERLVDHDLPTSAPRARVLLCVVAFLPLLAVVLAAPAVATAAAVPAAMPLADPMARPVVSPRPDAPATLEYEITLLEDEITTLLALLAQVEEPPAALRVAAARLQTRLEALKLRRPALAGAPSKEMPR